MVDTMIPKNFSHVLGIQVCWALKQHWWNQSMRMMQSIYSKNTDDKIITDGTCVLGATDGSIWISNKVHFWVDELITLKLLLQPKPVCSALTHGTMGQWTYI